MTYHCKGSCQCGNVSLALNLPNEISRYTPRTCDCDYCTKRQAFYLSTPKGTLVIQSKKPLKKEKQGSQQATFLLCDNCNTLVAVTYDFGSAIKGAVNAAQLTEKHQLLKAVPASPKHLSPEEKLARWHALWLEVSIRPINQY